MNQMYGFDGEVKAKYSTQMAELFTEVYNWLPLAHCLNNRVLVSLIQRKSYERYNLRGFCVFKISFALCFHLQSHSIFIVYYMLNAR